MGDRRELAERQVVLGAAGREVSVPSADHCGAKAAVAGSLVISPDWIAPDCHLSCLAVAVSIAR